MKRSRSTYSVKRGCSDSPIPSGPSMTMTSSIHATKSRFPLLSPSFVGPVQRLTPSSLTRRMLMTECTRRYTAVELAQHINHSHPRIYGQSYVANTSAVCGKSTVLNQNAQDNHVDYFQSFAKFREKGLPTKLPAEKEDAIRRDPQFLEFESEVQRLKRQRAPTCDMKAAESKARVYRASLTKK